MPTKSQKTSSAELVARFVYVQLIEDGQRWTVGPGDRRTGQRGKAVAIIGLRHAGGYEVVLHLDNGKFDSFAPMQLFPEA